MSSALPIPGIPLAYCVCVSVWVCVCLCVRACLLSNTGEKNNGDFQGFLTLCICHCFSPNLCQWARRFQKLNFLNKYLTSYLRACKRPSITFPRACGSLAWVSPANVCLCTEATFCVKRADLRHISYTSAPLQAASLSLSYRSWSKKEQFVWKMLTLVPISIPPPPPPPFPALTSPSKSHSRVQCKHCGPPRIALPGQLRPQGGIPTILLTAVGPWALSVSQAPGGHHMDINYPIMSRFTNWCSGRMWGHMWGFWGSVRQLYPASSTGSTACVGVCPRCLGNRIP